jgi:hypothetical protein
MPTDESQRRDRAVRRRAFHDQHRIPRKDKRRRFAEEYVTDLNATQAAKRAGYSKKTAYAQGSRLLKDAEVRAAIEVKLAQKTEKANVTVERIIAGVLRIAERCEVSGRAFNPFAALKAYELLGKYKRCWTDKTELIYDDAINERLEAGRKRVLAMESPSPNSRSAVD